MEAPLVSEKTQSEVVAKAPTSNATAQQFKIVKVRKPDGTIVKVKRPITAEEAAKLTAAPAKPEPSSAELPKPTQNVETPDSTPKSTSATSKTPTPETKKADEGEKSSSEGVEKMSAPQKAPDSEKVSTTPSQDPAESKAPVPAPAGQSPLSKTDRTLNTVAHGARLYKGLHRLHRGSSRLVSVLAPQWDIDDWQEGDEDFSDDDDDDNDEDEEKYESDDEQDTKHEAASSELSSATKGLAHSTASNIPTMNTPRSQIEISEKKSEPAAALPQPKKTAVVNEKEVSGSDLDNGSLEKSGPEGGKNLQKKYKDWSRYIIWAIMILFPLLFMIIGILVAVRDGQPVGDSLGDGTNQALSVAISVWPIIFAAIVAQSLRAYATYRVERGVRLMTLEQLVNSNSVASSIKQPFLLRRFNWITVALLVLWGLSPLATQAMQRISKTKSDDYITPSWLRYVDTAKNNSNYLSAPSDEFSNVEADFNRLYSAAFLPTYVTLGSDPYNNALIPLLDDPSNKTHWQDVDPTAGYYYLDYASAYGVPVAVMNSSFSDDYFSDTATFNVTISTGYLAFTCPPLRIVDLDFIDNSTLTTGYAEEATLYLDLTPMSGHTNGSLALASMITRNTTAAHPFDLDTGVDGFNYTFAYTNCTFSQVFVDANVSCQSGSCYTYAIRPTNLTNTTLTPGFLDSGSANWVTGILGSSGYTNDSVPTATDTERYLISNGRLSDSLPRMNLTTVDLDDFTYNLAFLMNTFWSIGFAPKNLTNVFYNSTSEPFNKDLGSSPLVSWAAGSKIDSYEIYVTKWGWLAALMICSVFLLLAGIFSIWWDARTVSPDVLGFASSVVRKSKYVQLPPVASAASGAERARALGDVRVMMQDVKPSATVGRIALGTAHPNAQRLQPGRTYR
ncbi:uncharacterized protein LY89DRAFT_242512 [Mollisia scopiformis]|uniref:Uncharacterized protein n=1 Tax=Mollisia scopiformis TaxID=149040 RepID=A0A194WTP4_MOLSC|nr:uncharacterized protein LY89DRAFT_242512 [Mollisia scopiformis]KUJ11328.1 hypothetical protein LY89DRAFT_242512 [Mollisia scopiformis]